MAPDNGPVTKEDLRQAVAAIKELIMNEVGHVAEETDTNTKWRLEFMAEKGPWRGMDQRVQALETFAESMKKTMGRISTLFYAVLTAVLIWAIMGIIAALPKLAALLGAS